MAVPKIRGTLWGDPDYKDDRTMRVCFGVPSSRGNYQV